MTGVARDRRAPQRWQADLSLAVVAMLWGTTFVVVQDAIHSISVMYFLALRFAFASLCMLALFWKPLRRLRWNELWRGLRGGIIAGTFLCIGYVLQTAGLRYTTAGNSGFITGLYIILVPLIGAAVWRRWPRAREMGGLLLATAGLLLLTFPADELRVQLNRGDLLTVGCAVAFAGHLLLLGFYSQHTAFEAVALGQIAWTALLSFGSLVFEPPVAHWSNRLIFGLVLTSVFATAVAFALQTWGQRYTTANRTALIFALEPVFAFVTSVYVGSDRITAHAIGGGALILTGILLVEMRSKVAERAEAGHRKQQLEKS